MDIDKIQSILVVLEMINSSLFVGRQEEDVKAVRAYIHSLEDIIPCEILAELTELVNNIVTQR